LLSHWLQGYSRVTLAPINRLHLTKVIAPAHVPLWSAGVHNAALYPALAKVDEKGHAVKAYTEQSAAKLQMGLLEDLPPMSQDFLDKLGHIEGAVAHHVYEEESNWLLDLKSKTALADQIKLTQRYQEHFARYMGDDSDI
jgi:hypothetical protein